MSLQIKKQQKQLEKLGLQWLSIEQKGSLRMKKKKEKANKTYYDFDYSKLQYYYYFPRHYVVFQQPKSQREWLRSHLEILKADPVKEVTAQPQTLTYPAFTKHMADVIRKHITSLRITKTLYFIQTHSHKNQSYCELIDAEIRSWLQKVLRIEAQVLPWGESTVERQTDKRSALRPKQLDELYFSILSKLDIISFHRLQRETNSLKFKMSVIHEQLKIYALTLPLSQVQKQTQLSQDRLHRQSKRYLAQDEQLRNIVEGKILSEMPSFMENGENRRQLHNYLQKMSYLRHCWLKDTELIYRSMDRPPLVPYSSSELADMVIGECSGYIEPSVLRKYFDSGQYEQLQFKLAGLAAITNRILNDTNTLVSQVKQPQQLDYLTGVMKRELETLFTSQINQLLGLPRYEHIMIVGKPSLSFSFQEDHTESQKQRIMRIIRTDAFIDPLCKSLACSLGVNSGKDSTRLIEECCHVTLEGFKNKLISLRWWYNSLSQTSQERLLLVLHNTVSLRQLTDEGFARFDSMQAINSKMNFNFMHAVYELIYANCRHYYKEILQILNSQECLLLQLRFRMSYLQATHCIPYCLTRQLMETMTETSVLPNAPYSFIDPSSQQPTNTTNEDLLRAKQFLSDQVVVQGDRVRVIRRHSHSPLLENKKIIYSHVESLVQQLLGEIVWKVSHVLRKVEDCHPKAEKLTHLTDRIVLIKQILAFEQSYQLAKLKLGIQIHRLFMSCNDGQTLAIAYRALVSLKKQVVLTDPTLYYYSEIYQDATASLICQAEILQLLIDSQINQQKLIQRENSSQVRRSSAGPSESQFSSFYCVEEQDNRQVDDILQNPQKDKEDRLDLSDEPTILLEAHKITSTKASLHERFMPKATFKDILTQNSINNIQIDQTKKKAVYNDRCPVIKDSVLGLQLVVLDDIHYSIPHVWPVYEEVCSIFKAKKGEIARRVTAELCLDFIRNELKQVVKYDKLSSDQRLQFSLDAGRKVIAELQEKIVPISQQQKNLRADDAITDIDHLLCLSPELVEGWLYDSSAQETNQMRGLYTLINALQCEELSYQAQVDKYKLQYLRNSAVPLLKKYMPSSSSGIQLVCPDMFPAFPHMKTLFDNQSVVLPLHGYKVSLSIATQFRSSIISYYTSVFAFATAVLEQHIWTHSQLLGLKNYGILGETLLPASGIKWIENKIAVDRAISRLDNFKNSLLPNDLEEIFNFPNLIAPKRQLVLQKSFKDHSQLISYLRQHEAWRQAVEQARIKLDFLRDHLTVLARSLEDAQKLRDYIQELPQLCRAVQVHPKYHPSVLEVFSQLQFKTAFKAQHNYSVNYKISLTDLKAVLEKHTFSNRDKWWQRSYPEIESITTKKDILPNSSVTEPHSAKWGLSDFLRWLQFSILLFGLTLSEKEQAQLMNCLMFSEANRIFWIDSTRKMLQLNDLMKLRRDQSHSQIIQRYYTESKSYQALKENYEEMIDELSKVPVLTTAQLYNTIRVCSLDGHSYARALKAANSLTWLLNYGAIDNPADPAAVFAHAMSYWDIKNWPKLSVEQLRHQQWSRPLKQRQRLELSVSVVIKTALQMSSGNTAEYSLVNHYVSAVICTRTLLRVCESLREQVAMEPFDPRRLIDSLAVEVIDSGVPMTDSEHRLWTTGVLPKEQSKLLKEMIAQCKCWEMSIHSFFLACSSSSLRRQIETVRYLLDDIGHVQQSEQGITYKQTINKVLAPKVPLHPFFNSPLCADNKLVAGGLKLAFVDYFLSKLKNKAIMIELAEGGFGFLLKVSELDECVQSLCSSIIAFTEKEFRDRFRTMVMSMEELKQEHRVLLSAHNQLKGEFNSLKSLKAVNIESLLYSKLTSSIQILKTKHENYDEVWKILKHLQAEVARTFDSKYQQRISDLEAKIREKDAFIVDLKRKVTDISAIRVKEATQVLTTQFQQQTAQVISRRDSHLLLDSHQSPLKIQSKVTHKSHQSPDQQEDVAQSAFIRDYTLETQKLLKQISQRKTFYLLQKHSLQHKIAKKCDQKAELLRKNQQVMARLHQTQNKLRLMEVEVSKLQQVTIEISHLRHWKEEQEARMAQEKLKFVRVIDPIKPKTSVREPIPAYQSRLPTSVLKPKMSDSFTETAHRPQFRSMRVKTEVGSNLQALFESKVDASAVWRVKWETVENKYRNLRGRVFRCAEIYRTAPNSITFREQLGSLCLLCKD